MFVRVNSIILAISALLLTTACDSQHEGNREQAITPEMQEKVEMIRGKVKEYVDAVNAKDIETILNQWSDQAVYKNPFTGELANGREGIRNEYRKILDQIKDGKVSIDVKTVRFPIDEKAVEEGTATLIIPGKDPQTSDYKMIYVKEGDDWLILHVSELGFGLEENQ